MKRKIIILLSLALILCACDKKTVSNNEVPPVNNEVKPIEYDDESGINTNENILKKLCNDKVCVEILSMGYNSGMGAISAMITNNTKDPISGSVKLIFESESDTSELTISYDFTNSNEKYTEKQFPDKDLSKATSFSIENIE